MARRRLTWDSDVVLTVRIRKYLWHEFVQDVCIAIYVVYILLNSLSKRLFHCPVRESLKRLLHGIKWAFWIWLAGVWTYLLVASAFGWR